MPAIRVVTGPHNALRELPYKLDDSVPLDTVLQQLCAQFGLKEHHSHFALYKDYTSAQLTDTKDINENDELYLRALPAQVFITRAELSTKSAITASQAFKHLNDHLILLSLQDPTNSSPIIISPGLIEKIVQVIQSKAYFIDLLVRVLNWGNTTVQDQHETKIDLFSAVNNALDAFEKRTKTNFYLFLLNDAKNEGMVMRCVNVGNRLLSLAPPDIRYMEYLVELGVIDKLLSYISSTSSSLQAALASFQSHLLSILDKRSSTTLNFTNAEQSEKLERIWYVSFPKTKYPGPESDDWRWLGFKGLPVQNFGQGALGLDNMSYFAMSYSLTFRSMLLEQSELSFQFTGYPMGSTGAQITALLVKVYNIGTPRYVSQPIKLLFGPDLGTLFNELYCTTFKVWDWLWTKAGFSFPQYQQSLGLLSSAVEKVYTKNLTTLKEFEDATMEVLLAEITSRNFTKSKGDTPAEAELETQGSAPQPSNVKSYKLKKLLGANTNIKHNADQQGEDEEDDEDEDTKAKRLDLERARRLRGFFGEWFDVKEVEFSEKLKSSYEDSTAAGISFQPENARDKLQKFFGERVMAPLRPMSEGDDEDALTRRTNYKLKQMLGETVDKEASSAQTYATQPAHVKVYKLDRKFGEKTPFRTEEAIASEHPNSNGTDNASDEEDDDSLDENGHHKKSLQKYFGERFDVEQVVHEEKVRPREDAPVKAAQPEHARVDKIHRFFGERMSIRVVNGVPVYEAEEKTELPEEDEDQPRARKNTMLKARRQLGEGIDVEKESNAVNFAPQPGHVKAFKLDKMFGQRVPHSAGAATTTTAAGNGEDDDDDDDENSKDRERRRRLQTFFGERFDDLDKVVEEEKLKASLAGEQRQVSYPSQNNTEEEGVENGAKKEKKKREVVGDGPKKEKKENDGRERKLTLRRKKKEETSV